MRNEGAIMKEREIVIRLRLPASVRKRWQIALAAALLCIGAVAYATLPYSFTTGDQLSSTKLNGNFSNLDGRLTTLEGKSQTVYESFINCLVSGCSYTQPNGTWITNIVVNGNGYYTANLTSGAFTSPPICVGTPQASGSQTTVNLSPATATIGIKTYNSAGAATDGLPFNIICIGK
jgi:hypothetical protein